MPAALRVGDRISMAFSSSMVSGGQGVGVVTATGQDTEIGKISDMLAEVDGEGYAPEGAITLDDEVSLEDHDDLRAPVEAMAVANDAELQQDSAAGDG